MDQLTLIKSSFSDSMGLRLGYPLPTRNLKLIVEPRDHQPPQALRQSSTGRLCTENLTAGGSQQDQHQGGTVFLSSGPINFGLEN